MGKKKVIKVGQVSALPAGCMVGHACDCKLEGNWANVLRGFHERYLSRYNSRLGSKLSIRRIPSHTRGYQNEFEAMLDELAFENLILKATIEICVPPKQAEAFDEALYKRFEGWNPGQIMEENEVVDLVKGIWKELGKK